METAQRLVNEATKKSCYRRALYVERGCLKFEKSRSIDLLFSIQAAGLVYH